MKVGIDFGTCTTSMCVNYKGKKQLLKCGTGSSATEFYIPSAVYLEENGQLLIGQAAEQSKMRNPQRFVNGFKRNLGEKIPLRLGEKDFLPEQLVQEVLVYLRSTAQESEIIGQGMIEELTLCHPANFSENKKELLKKAALNAGFKKVSLLDEPTAAAFYYNSIGKINTDDNILVYDLGGGTFDVSLMKKTKEGLKLLTRPLGIEECGGNDFDIAVYEFLFQHSEDDLQEMINQYPYEAKLMFTSMLEVKCVQAKEYLSSSEKAEISYQYGFNFKHLDITRKDFENLIEEYIEETVDKVDEVIKKANLTHNDVDKIILVGGSCRIPYIKNKLEAVLGEKVVKDVDPDWAVVYGAACEEKAIPNSLEPTIIRCKNCLAELEEDAQFCPCCGISVNKIERIFCPKCGLEIKKGDKFCLRCGKSLDDLYPTINPQKNDDIHFKEQEIKHFLSNATLVKGIEKTNGKLLITNKKLEFRSSYYHSKVKSIILLGCDIDKVTKIKNRNTLLPVICVFTKQGKQYNFSVGFLAIQKVIEVINELIQNSNN